ncbi:MAG: hypothetical protein Q7R96_01820 [Nanoarchaeota archaeon]|nr:hypothetical protein [Nanoarchaeota archaeon]
MNSEDIGYQVDKVLRRAGPNEVFVVTTQSIGAGVQEEDVWFHAMQSNTRILFASYASGLMCSLPLAGIDLGIIAIRQKSSGVVLYKNDNVARRYSHLPLVRDAEAVHLSLIGVFMPLEKEIVPEAVAAIPGQVVPLEEEVVRDADWKDFEAAGLQQWDAWDKEGVNAGANPKDGVRSKEYLYAHRYTDVEPNIDPDDM